MILKPISLTLSDAMLADDTYFRSLSGTMHGCLR